MVEERLADNNRLKKEFPTATKWGPAADECEWFLAIIREAHDKERLKQRGYMKEYYAKHKGEIISTRKSKKESEPA